VLKVNDGNEIFPYYYDFHFSFLKKKKLNSSAFSISIFQKGQMTSVYMHSVAPA